MTIGRRRQLRQILLDLSPRLVFDRHPFLLLSGRVEVDRGGSAGDFVFLGEVQAAVLFDGRFQNLHLLPCQRSIRLSAIHIGQNTMFQENSDTGPALLSERKNVRNTEKNMENTLFLRVSFERQPK